MTQSTQPPTSTSHNVEDVECRSCDQLMTERDAAEEMCQKLADAIAAHLGIELGEHSSGNFPWQNALEALGEAEPAVAFLLRGADGHHRIVSSADLTSHQIAEAQAAGKFWVDPDTKLGWALLPWSLTTSKDEQRSAKP